MKKKNEFKTISEGEIIVWAIYGLSAFLSQISSRAADLREEGKSERAEDLRKDFNRLKDQYLELFRQTYTEELEELSIEIVRRYAKLGWGDEKK